MTDVPSHAGPHQPLPDNPRTDLVPTTTDVPANFDQQMHMAKVLAQSSLLPQALRNQPANVLIIMMGARSMGLPAFWALQSFHVIDGKLSMSADIMKARVIAAGHRFRVVERTAQRAVVRIIRRDDPEPYEAEFTIDDAKAAELLGKGNWRKYPKAMMVARATSIAVRDHCPEVLFGVLYTPDELGVETDDEGTPVDHPRTIEHPNPDDITARADQLESTVDPETSTMDQRLFADLWRVTTSQGWALHKVPGSDESLLDVATRIVYNAVIGADNLETLRDLWNLINRAGFSAMHVNGIRLVDAVRNRRAMLESITEAQTVEPADETNTEKLQREAAASWNEEGHEEP